MIEIIYMVVTIATCIALAILADKYGIKRDINNQEIAGVCAGIAKRFDVPAGAVRIGFVLSVLFFGIGIIPYIVLWAVLKEEEEE